ncbi:MAG: hypothetical protein RLZZ562_2 [Planctomycetota bacterium]|jgi:hypothetical protein
MHSASSSSHPDRREFLGSAASAAAAIGAMSLANSASAASNLLVPSAREPLFTVSLAQWSLHRTFSRDGKDNLEFPKKAKSYGIDAIEYVNSFFKDKARDEAYLNELDQRCKGEGVQSVLIMVDGEGELGHPDKQKRAQAVENHHKWVECAKRLGCHSIRVNAQSSGSWAEQTKLAVDGLRRLCEFADGHGINVIVENHGGLSSNGKWLSTVLAMVDHPRVGALPDFGNFRVSKDETYDRYIGTSELMPFAKGVSAKSHDFDDQGNETGTDYRKMLKICVLDHGWRGRIGIEYEGGRLSEDEGIKATHKLLLQCRDEMAAQR